MTILSVPLDQLVVLDDLYPREKVDAERVGVFAELLSENPSSLAPVRVARLDGVAGYVVSDGVHRLCAHQHIGSETITVDMWGVADRPAIYLDALRTTTESAKPLTRVEKKEAVARLHAHGHSQREIGRLLGIPQSTVNDWVTGSGHPTSTDCPNRRAATKLERVASQLARALSALDRMVEEDESDEDTVILALINCLGHNGVELLALVSEALGAELGRA